MKNLRELFEKYPRVYPALHRTLIGKGIYAYEDTEDILHDFFIAVADKINWDEEDAIILSFLYKGFALFTLNKANALKNIGYYRNNKEIARQALFTEKDGEEVEIDLLDTNDRLTTYALAEDVKKLLTDESITGNLRNLVTYYVDAIERNACEEDFRRSTIADSMGVTREYVRKMSNTLADYLSSYAPAKNKRSDLV